MIRNKLLLKDPSLIIGDSRRLDKHLKGKPLANVVITSPPYFQMLDYGTKNEIGKGSADYKSFLKDLGSVFKGCFFHTTDNASLWVICDNFRTNGLLIDLPGDIKVAATKEGWKLRDIIIWNKVKTRPTSGPNFRNNMEFILFFVKNPSDFKFRIHRENSLHGSNADYLWKWPERYSPLGLNPGKIWTIPIMNQGTWSSGDKERSTRIHFCPFPQQLVSRILNIASDVGDIVLDPFAGSGTVLAQAEVMGRYGIGVEMNPKFRTFYKEIRGIFKSEWESNVNSRQLVLEDRIREALLINRMRALKATSILLNGSSHALRYIREICIIEPTTSAEIAEKAFAEKANSAEIVMNFNFHILCDQLSQVEAVRLKGDFEKAMSSCSVKGHANIHSDRGVWKKQRELLSANWWIYDGSKSLRPMGDGSKLKSADQSKFPLTVLCNFSAPAYGSHGSPLESILSKVRQAYIKETAQSVGGDENEVANILGITKVEVHRHLNGNGNMRKASRSREHVENSQSVLDGSLN